MLQPIVVMVDVKTFQLEQLINVISDLQNNINNIITSEMLTIRCVRMQPFSTHLSCMLKN